ncbi:4-hydroxy-tetrahydrodipicolinate reductase [uncultured Actinomyces sp.]|uniref:4-hydroxy-tetrahydrodipicolinate reductase n=1 Tax=uncultured Actinomyces sp. TaxID=249061 RepID=UPI0028EA35E9|nr:4-hydroxy-tetrahydrodipicolinate reductase [uncultured Actinomyces sp.]
MIRVAVTGAKGRMGSTVVAAVTGAPDMEVVAQLDAGDPITKKTVNGAQVAVDFSVPGVTEANVHALLDVGVDVVVGTTGWTEESYARVRTHAQEAGRAVLIAPNFAMGAVLAMKFAAMAAPYFESAEVIEMHHPGKVDAPSGTAVATARGIARARAEAGLGDMPDATEMDELGSRGGRVDGVPVHAVRLRGLTASEEILLGNEGEQLVIRTDSFDRVSFMPGVLLGVRRVIGRTGLTIGLDQVMGL